MDGLGMRSPEVQSQCFTPNNFESQSRIDYAKLRPQLRSERGGRAKKSTSPHPRLNRYGVVRQTTNLGVRSSNLFGRASKIDI
jgi:hypothetical protein